MITDTDRINHIQSRMLPLCVSYLSPECEGNYPATDVSWAVHPGVDFRREIDKAIELDKARALWAADHPGTTASGGSPSHA